MVDGVWVRRPWRARQVQHRVVKLESHLTTKNDLRRGWTLGWVGGGYEVGTARWGRKGGRAERSSKSLCKIAYAEDLLPRASRNELVLAARKIEGLGGAS